jgi:hypothetical protein
MRTPLAGYRLAKEYFVSFIGVFCLLATPMFRYFFFPALIAPFTRLLRVPTPAYYCGAFTRCHIDSKRGEPDF